MKRFRRELSINMVIDGFIFNNEIMLFPCFTFILKQVWHRDNLKEDLCFSVYKTIQPDKAERYGLKFDPIGPSHSLNKVNYKPYRGSSTPSLEQRAYLYLLQLQVIASQYLLEYTFTKTMATYISNTSTSCESLIPQPSSFHHRFPTVKLLLRLAKQ